MAATLNSGLALHVSVDRISLINTIKSISCWRGRWSLLLRALGHPLPPAPASTHAACVLALFPALLDCAPGGDERKEPLGYHVLIDPPLVRLDGRGRIGAR
eukprot:2958430-Rhodomonas_salina.1